jgi:predicted Zn finger-like uncharacterized protein
MRLTCPNCDAEYSVDDAAIPPSGRDVQCSNCGHAWFQLHPDAEAEAAKMDVLFGAAPAARAAEETPAAVQRPAGTDVSSAGRPAPPQPAPPSLDMAEPAVAGAPAPDAEDDGRDAGTDADEATVVQPKPEASAAAAPQAPPAAARTLDENLLSILREEAARESAERRAEAPAMPEVQPDLGLIGMASAPAPVAPPVSPVESATAATADLDAMEAAGAMHDRVAPRRDLLPDIEEINSTLRAGSEARGAEAEAMVLAEKARARGGFRAGFIFTLVFAALLTLAYTMAPRIAEHLPGSAPVMASYVASVDKARLWLDGAMQKAAGTLRGLTGETP